MQIHNLTQGTPEWHAYRAEHDNASDAPAMMGCSPYKTRSELLQERRTGLAQEVDAPLQRIFDDGHRFEAQARPLAEKIIGEDLYPVTGSNGRMSASFDGLTMDERIDYEHKSLNDVLRVAMVQGCTGKDLPMVYQVQMEQQLAVSGAEKCLFMASKWDGETLVEERHCWYLPNLELRQQIIDGWAQFHADLATFTPVITEVKPVGRTPETLPALHVEVTGMVTASNLAQYKEHALAVFSGINRELKTDQHFADARKIVKWCSDVEERLEAVKEHALSQTSTIDELFKTIDAIKAEARTTRLDLDKVITKRDKEVKEDMVVDGKTAYAEHVLALNKEIAPAAISLAAPDFAAAIKGKRSIESMQDAVDTVLANGKIAADAAAKAIRANLVIFHQAAEGYEFLFADLAQLVHKAADDFSLAVTARIDAHKAKLEAARVEQEKRDSDAKAAAEIKPVEVPAIEQPTLMHGSLPVSRAQFERTYSSPVKAVPATPPSLRLGVINERLAPIQVTAEGLRMLGFEHAAKDRAAVLYHDADFTLICAALVRHINSIQVAQAA